MAEPERELLETPMYTATMAGRLAGLRAERVRRWLQGYEFSYRLADGERRHRAKRPVVERSGTQPFASFLDLIDLLFVKQFIEHGVSLQRLREALEEAKTLLGGHHFAQRSFFTSGLKIYLQVRKDADALLELLSGGQWVIAPIIRQLAHQIDFHDTSGLAERWFPCGRDGRVVLDPRVSFGAPTIRDRGVETANVVRSVRCGAQQRRESRLVDESAARRSSSGCCIRRAACSSMKFFIDNNLSPLLARGMSEFGEDVIHLQEKFAADANDEAWLPYLGANEYVLITRDEAIRWKPAEIAALRRHKVGAFFLGGKNLQRCALIQQLVRNWPRMKEIAVSERRPFAYRIPPNGTNFSRIAV